MFDQETSLLAARFAQLAQTQGTQRAITFRGEEHQPGHTFDNDFGRFWRRIERVSAHLQASWGVQRGDRVAWLGLNHELQLVTLVACARLGAVFVSGVVFLAITLLRVRGWLANAISPTMNRIARVLRVRSWRRGVISCGSRR